MSGGRFEIHAYTLIPPITYTTRPLPLPTFSCRSLLPQDQVQCKKNLEQCVGGCSGDLTSSLKYDFNTMIAISELNPDVLGEDGFYAAAADCNVRQGVIEVPMFEGGDRWVLARTLTRTLLPTHLRLTDSVLSHYVQFQDLCRSDSDAMYAHCFPLPHPTMSLADTPSLVSPLCIAAGMTALDDTWCEENPLSCGVIQVHYNRHDPPLLLSSVPN